jgi:hypothetical protein
MAVPASFMDFTKSRGCAALLRAGDAIIGIGLVPLSATVRALASIVDTQILVAKVALVVQVQEEVLGDLSVKDLRYCGIFGINHFIIKNQPFIAPRSVFR